MPSFGARSFVAPAPFAAVIATLLLTAPRAWATSDCTDFAVTATQPSSEQEVPRGAILRAFIDDVGCSGSPALRVVCGGESIAFGADGDEVLEAALPADASSDGTGCSLEVWDDFDSYEVVSVPFTIAADDATPPPPPAAPALVSAEMRHHQRPDGTADPHHGDVVVEVGADPLGMTIVRVVDPASGEDVRRRAPAPPGGGTVELRDLLLMGDGTAEVCFRIETVNAVGTSAGTDVCASSTPSPTGADGCSVVPSSPRGAATTLALVLAALAAARHRGTSRSRADAAGPAGGRR